MSKSIYVIGHKNPDTDSICAALGYANLKRLMGMEAVAYRAGEVNLETRFVLDYFKVPEPELIEDLRTKVGELATGPVTVVGPEMTLQEAWRLMREKGIKNLPVVNNDHRLIGLVTQGDLAEKYFDDLGGQDLENPNLVVTNMLKCLQTPVGTIAGERELVVFEDDDLLMDARKAMLETRFRCYPVVNDQYRVVGTISRFNLLGFDKKQVILVDHNELSHAVEGMEDTQILEIVDHHRVGGLQTGEPILFRNEPLGSTCTLVAKAYFEAGITPSAAMAGIMCGAILSDTLVFKSPTCTQTDKQLAAQLAELAGIDALAFGTEMFRQATSLRNLTPLEAIETDFKEFAMANLRIGIGQVSVMGTDELDELKDTLLQAMESYRYAQGLDMVLLMITDLLAEGTYLLNSGAEDKIISKAFNVEVVDNQAYLAGVMSRKKQIVPPLSKFFSK